MESDWTGRPTVKKTVRAAAGPPGADRLADLHFTLGSKVRAFFLFIRGVAMKGADSHDQEYGV
ncbi:MAG: hypothetical protein HFG77_03605 [Hungatella sp.]|nr:hypothetical protein [Hungatella sp.]